MRQLSARRSTAARPNARRWSKPPRASRSCGTASPRRGRLRDLDLEVQSLQQKRAKVEADLYGGRIRNPKELESINDEGAALDRTRSSREDDMLALLDEVERLEPQERDAREALETAKGY